MKVHELLLENITLTEVGSVRRLVDPKTREYYTGEVNVRGDVQLNVATLETFPVKFGKVGGNFYCHNNKLTSLEGAPTKVGKDFNCGMNKLTSLEGAPREIGKNFACNSNGIQSLEGIHKIIKKLNGLFVIRDNPIKSGGIGLLLIEGLEQIYSELPAFKIINKYLGQGKAGLLRCQEELIEAGYEEFAKL